jgi:hypothetical protein
VVGTGADAATAQAAAYELAGTIEIRGGWYRRQSVTGDRAWAGDGQGTRDALGGCQRRGVQELGASALMKVSVQ